MCKEFSLDEYSFCRHYMKNINAFYTAEITTESNCDYAKAK